MLSALGLFAVGDALLAQGILAPPPQSFNEFSTHDATTTQASIAADLFERWADVKSTGALTPGHGWRFLVGTIDVKTTQPQDNPTFSDEPIALPPLPASQGGFSIAPGATVGTKQIVVLQARGPDPAGSANTPPDQEIRWQRYFYGDSGLTDSAIGRPATNARAVSVWPVLDASGHLDPDETRIAICGESFDCRLPNSQYANGNDGRMKFSGGTNFATNFPRGLPSGFIAVYRGNGEHLWTHQFCYQDVAIPAGNDEGACAITDVSIRVETIDGVVRDIVTYCGISSFGLRASETSALTPSHPFDLTGTTGIDGEYDNTLGQWDGIVGRISNVHSTSPVLGTATIQEFHSVVGGSEQDGLWGIAEMPEDRFAVVGTTAREFTTNPPFSTYDFPFTASPVTTNVTPPNAGSGEPTTWPGVTHCLGTMLVFDASQTRNASSPNALVLESSTPIGRAGWLDEQTVAATVARDVAVQLEAFPTAYGTLHQIALVGSTSDSALFSTVNALPVTSHGGLSDGFLLTAEDRLLPGTPPSPLFMSGTFQNLPEDGGWCGVHSWNEFRDHISVFGWIEDELGNRDFEVASFVVATATLVGTPPNQVPSWALLEVRRDTIATPASETPAAMGDLVATDPPSPAVPVWAEYDLGSPAGGGLAMDERGRLDLVGSTDPGTAGISSFPVVGGNLARVYLGGIDACRAVLTMLPYMVGRTDLSGEQVHYMGSIPAAPAGRTGATTPTCALHPFGWQLDGSGPPALRRMLIDWEGPHPYPSPFIPNSNPPQQKAEHFLLIDRPPGDWQWTASVVQFGVPTAPPAIPAVLPYGIENWVPSGSTTYVLVAGTRLSARIPLLLPPASGVTFSAQVVTASLAPFSCTGAGYAASPAIVFSY